ncbi:sarcosine oxidase subunit alpha family protein [Alphaproteobacteria bacterium KMM 3653]|uniref:Sarcosine oxidase subunit alpha family protein n=1 Tax=Harenicola maris TaxID=2841044 RepID=A0AAP2CT90_9RHOB|nr:sarcosine oxidase subunit alpha family protein [Harenicola maris]
MSQRLATGGRLIDRSQPRSFTFNGKTLQGYAGDTLASALLGADQMLVGRSFKYHRPRGVVASGAEEPNALMNMGEGELFEPNQRATTTELFEGLIARSQNHWPSLDYDIGALNQLAAPFFSAGFYYKTFIHPRAAWKHLFEPFIRKSAGLGQAPKGADGDIYEHYYAHVDVLVIGGGIAGLRAAHAAASAGARVLVIEQSATWGGRAPVDDDFASEINALVAELAAMDDVQMRLRLMGAGVYDHGFVTGYERLRDHAPKPGAPRHRLWKIRAQQVVSCTGAIERPLSFAGNDRPGVMLASAMRDYVVNHAVAPGQRTVLVTNNDDGYRTVLCLLDHGLEVPLVIDARRNPEGTLAAKARARGVTIRDGYAAAGVRGTKRVTGIEICPIEGSGGAVDTVECDAVAMSGGWSPVVHFYSHCGGKLLWDEAGAFFYPDAAKPPLNQSGAGFVRCGGAANGALQGAEAAQCGGQAGAEAARALGLTAPVPSGPAPEPQAEAPLMPVWVMPLNADYHRRSHTWLDFQNDVKLSDVQLAAREGYESVEHTKRYTTLGMATDQGKLSNINGLAVLSDALDASIPQVGTTTFRPPYTPISLGSIAGEARGDTFQPLRRTPMHDWHEANGVHWEPVGHWRRPYAYPRSGETVEQAVHREVKNTREALGLLDASTLGKILVTGPDAGKFLDMLYTNMMSSLKPGRCRYGLMCNENGFLMDDGVVARLDENSFLVHTTSGGAEHIHAHMEDWLQCEWWDWQVHTVNLTEEYAQIAVVGPHARKLLEKLGGMDFSAENLPFMGWAEGQIGGFDTRVFRISFSGELSFEVAVPAAQGAAFWDRLVKEGADLGLMPYGTEALHILRAEKGFIMIGDETDGTVIPQDLGLHWAISKKKTDYLGKRAQERPHMTDPARWKLVGLETISGAVLPDGAYATAPGYNANDQRNTQGRVTSTYYSPTLERGIAMGLVLNGPDRMGEVLNFPGTNGQIYRARIVDPVFYDKEGAKQNV